MSKNEIENVKNDNEVVITVEYGLSLKEAEFAMAWGTNGENHSELCRQIGIDRKTGYRWKEKAEIIMARDKYVQDKINQAKARNLKLLDKALEVREELLSSDDPKIKYQVSKDIYQASIGKPTAHLDISNVTPVASVDKNILDAEQEEFEKNIIDMEE